MYSRGGVGKLGKRADQQAALCEGRPDISTPQERWSERDVLIERSLRKSQEANGTRLSICMRSDGNPGQALPVIECFGYPASGSRGDDVALLESRSRDAFPQTVTPAGVG